MSKKAKTVIYLLLAILLIMFSQLVPPIPLYERGIVVGMAVDVTDEGQFEVAVQIVVPGNTSLQDKKSGYAIISGKGDSVTDALEVVAKEAAVIPSYAHCDLLLVGEDALIDSFTQTANILFSKGILSGDTEVIAVKGKANSTLSSPVPIQDIAAFYINQAVSLQSKKGGRKIVTLKDFIEGLMTEEAVVFLPYAVKLKTADSTTGNNSASSEKYVFDIGRILVSKKDGNCIFESEITEGVGLVESNNGAVIVAECDEGTFSVQIVRSYKTRTYSKEPYGVKSNYYYGVKLIDQNFKNTATELDYDKLALEVTDTILKKIRTSYQAAKAEKVDIFNLGTRLYKRYGVAVPLDEIEWEVNITVRFK